MDVFEEVAPGGGPRRSGRPARAARGLIGVVAAVAVAALAVVVAQVRPAPPPAPDAPPSTTSSRSTTDDAAWLFAMFRSDGYGPVSIGLAPREFRRAACGGVCDAGKLQQVSLDPDTGCSLQVRPPRSPGENTLFAWVRGRTVVAVGLLRAETGIPVATPLGRSLGGEARDVAGDGLVPLASARVADGATVAVADLDRDGVLDYVATAGDDGMACGASKAGTLSASPGSLLGPVPDGPGIEGESIGGVALGMDEATARSQPGWQGAPFAGQTCSMIFDGAGGVAYLERGEVIGLGAPRVTGGPAAGQTLAEALPLLAPGATAPALRPVEGASRAGDIDDPWALSLELYEGRDAAGRRVVLDLLSQPVIVPGLLWPASVPPDLGNVVVAGVSVGRTCRDASP